MNPKSILSAKTGKILLAFTAATAIAMAQSVSDITAQVKANLEKSPWEANIVGKIQLPDGSTQDADFRVQVIPGKNETTRVDFNKPNALEGNFVVISKTEVWNYLFLTNQVIKQSRAKAKIDGLGVDLSGLGDIDQLTEKFTTKLSGTVTTPEGAAYKLVSTTKDKSMGYTTMEMLILKTDPRPYNIKLKDEKGAVVGDLTIKNFKRSKATTKTLKKVPADAEIIKK